LGHRPICNFAQNGMSALWKYNQRTVTDADTLHVVVGNSVIAIPIFRPWSVQPALVSSMSSGIPIHSVTWGLTQTGFLALTHISCCVLQTSDDLSVFIIDPLYLLPQRTTCINQSMNHFSLGYFFIVAKLPNNLELLQRPQTNHNLHYSRQLGTVVRWKVRPGRTLQSADETR